MTTQLHAPLLEQVSECLAAQIGLYFPADRHAELQRGLSAAARHMGVASTVEFAHQLLGAPLSSAQIEALAEHLTVGETYFFRDKKSFDALENNVLPALIQSRRESGQKQLRFWSAGCCTGEEPYSLAMTLSEILPDVENWRISILATDINPRFLQRAAAGVYGKWSFRTTPPLLQERYFTRLDDRHFQLQPRIRHMVRFAPLNLVEDDAYAALSVGGTDIILCRNVLMYLGRQQVARVIENFHRALPDGGWYVTSPAETSPLLASWFEPVNFEGTFFYRKPSVSSASREKTSVALPTPQPRRFVSHRTSPTSKSSGQTKITKAPSQVRSKQPTLEQKGFESHLEKARRCANRGELEQALNACDRAIAADMLHAASHYLRATVLQEQGDTGEAAAGFKRAIYLEPDFILAHFALGNLARMEGKTGEADRHFSHTIALLRGWNPEDIIPESGGVTAATLMETLVARAEQQKV